MATHPGKPVRRVNPAKETNAAAQISSGVRDILNTLQKRKKWKTTTPTIIPAHQIRNPRIIDPSSPVNKITISKTERRNPGLKVDEAILLLNVRALASR